MREEGRREVEEGQETRKLIVDVGNGREWEGEERGVEDGCYAREDAQGFEVRA
jgi:hypothetical protein